MSAYSKYFDEIKYMSFLIKDDNFLKKHDEIWEKLTKGIKKRFDSEPVYSEKYLETKIKYYEGKTNTNFNSDKIPKEGSQCICLSVILIDSVFRTGKNYYSQAFLEECKHVVKEKDMPEYITNDKETSSDDSDIEDSDYSDEENSNEESNFE